MDAAYYCSSVGGYSVWILFLIKDIDALCDTGDDWGLFILRGYDSDCQCPADDEAEKPAGTRLGAGIGVDFPGFVDVADVYGLGELFFQAAAVSLNGIGQCPAVCMK